MDAQQYAECAAEVLSFSQPGDWLGLGGWCILGLHKGWLPEFWRTIRLVLPMAASIGVRHAHIFGVMWPVALGGLLHLADELGMTVSTDSSSPILTCTWKNKRKSGARCHYWRDNVAWRQRELAELGQNSLYRSPPHLTPCRQQSLFDFVGD